METTAPAGLGGQDAADADGFEGDFDLGDGFAVEVAAIAIDIEQSIAGCVIKADADQLFWVVPSLPQCSGAQGIARHGFPVDLAVGVNGIGVEKAPGVVKGLAQPLTIGISG